MCSNVMLRKWLMCLSHNFEFQKPLRTHRFEVLSTSCEPSRGFRWAGASQHVQRTPNPCVLTCFCLKSTTPHTNYTQELQKPKKYAKKTNTKKGRERKHAKFWAPPYFPVRPSHLLLRTNLVSPIGQTWFGQILYNGLGQSWLRPSRVWGVQGGWVQRLGFWSV